MLDFLNRLLAHYRIFVYLYQAAQVHIVAIVLQQLHSLTCSRVRAPRLLHAWVVLLLLLTMFVAAQVTTCCSSVRVLRRLHLMLMMLLSLVVVVILGRLLLLELACLLAHHGLGLDLAEG